MATARDLNVDPRFARAVEVFSDSFKVEHEWIIDNLDHEEAHKAIMRLIMEVQRAYRTVLANACEVVGGV